MSKRIRQTNGFMLAELIVAMSLFALLLAGLTVSVGGFSAFNRHQWARQQCIAAAMAQLDSVAATGAPIDSDECKRLWPRVTVSLERTAGEGQWAGLERIDVKASAQAGPRHVIVELSRYITPAVQPAEEEGSL
ncbi:MAG: type II secretion system protein [Sedimentisphaerales bacterium]|nr:type II secretion system protein [Sedimentisphaerales bacterium]